MGQKRIFLDTMVFIYHFSDRLPYSEATQKLFTKINKGDIKAFTSTITITEVFIKPEREKEFEIILGYENFFKSLPNLEIVSIDWNIARIASKIRAKYPKLKTPDSLQIATALYTNCEVFLTNDKQLKNVKEIQVKML